MHLKELNSASDIKKIEQLLQSFYRNKDENYRLEDRPESDYEGYVKVIQKWTKSSGKVLDLGCGTYRTPELLSKKHFTVVGCDLFNENILKDYNDRYGSDHLSFKSYDGKKLPFKDDTFDSIATLCVFEHVLDVESLLNEIDRVLKPGGVVFILGPNIAGPHRIVKGINKLVREKTRYWQFESVFDCLFSGTKLLKWNLNVILSNQPLFKYVFPLLKDEQLLFEQYDDDAVHLNIPSSFRKWFQVNTYVLEEYNSDAGDSAFTKQYNRLLPDFATKLQIVARKLEGST